MEILDRDWQAYRDPSGFSLRFPPGWSAARHATGAAFVISPDRRAVVFVQEVTPPPGVSPAEVVQRGLFPAAAAFDQVVPGPIESGTEGRASCHLRCRFPDGGPAMALVTVESYGAALLVSVCAAREPLGLEKWGQLLWWITRGYQGPGMPIPDYWEVPHPPKPDLMAGYVAAPPTAPPPAAALSFVRFTDPTAGTFHIEVPQGWQSRGGFHHAGLGDRRMFAETHSREGISVLFGDPNFPQTFYHNPMSWGENFVPYPSGCTYLNLKASAQKLAAYYLKNSAPKRLGQFQTTAQRDRKDLAEEGKRRHPQLAQYNVTFHEVGLRVGNRTGQLLALSYGNKMAMMGDLWVGNVVVFLSPPGGEAVAWQVAKHMLESFEMTAQLNTIVMRDEAIIAGNGNIAIMNQQQWFQGQQAVHRSQEQVGNMISNNYWEQQRANESIVQGWNHNQQVNADIFQRGSDVMLGKERLYDETIGKEYAAPAGANYYWVDSASGNIVGTNTDAPPDYARDYRPLKKL